MMYIYAGTQFANIRKMCIQERNVINSHRQC